MRPTATRCSVPGCERPHSGQGLCEMHRKRLLRAGAAGEAAPRRVTAYDGASCARRRCQEVASKAGLCRIHYYRFLRDDPARPRCAVENCERNAEVRIWCGMHYKGWQRTGTPE